LDTLEGAFFEDFGNAQKPGIVNYAGLLQRGQGLQKQCPQALCTIRSYLDTARKQRDQMLAALRQAFLGKPLAFALG
jgi:hypothetical protein